MTKQLLDYCEAHNVSLDWLLCGDLKGLQRMVLARRIAKATAAESLAAKIARLPADMQEVVHKTIDQLLRGNST